MSQDFDIYLEDILEAIDRIQEYVQDVARPLKRIGCGLTQSSETLKSLVRLLNKCLIPFEKSIQVSHGGRLLD